MGFFQSVREDIQSVFERDPAATSTLAVLLCYPGVHARWIHHLTHWLWVHGFRLLPRWLSQVGRLLTGIEIHPGATIDLKTKMLMPVHWGKFVLAMHDWNEPVQRLLQEANKSGSRGRDLIQRV